MKILEIDYTTKIEFSNPVNDHYFLLRCIPVSRNGQTVIARKLQIEPEVPLMASKDIFENIAYQGRIDFPHEEFISHSTATVIVDKKHTYKEFCHPFYKYNTKLTMANNEMKTFLLDSLSDPKIKDEILNKKLKIQNFSQVAEELRIAIHKEIKYQGGITSVNTTAEQAFTLGTGVCQDFSHILCSLLREAGIPSRYVAGTSKGEGSTHAWSEYFIPSEKNITNKGSCIQGRWYGVDSTRNKNVDDTYVILASGRDYLDSRVDGGIFKGNSNQKMSVFVKTTEKNLTNNHKKIIKGKDIKNPINTINPKHEQQQM